MPNRIDLFPLALIRTAGLPFADLKFELADWTAFENACEAAIQEKNTHLDTLTCVWAETLAAIPQSPLRTSLYNARRKFVRQIKTGFEAPLGIVEQLEAGADTQNLFEAVQAWNSALSAEKKAKKQLETAWHSNLEAQYRTLQKVAANESLQRALLFASHDLLERLPVFTTKNPGDFGKKDRQTALALWQYAARAAYKTSPLSRFTTVSLQRLDQPEQEPETIFQESKVAVTPNVALLPAMYEVLLREPAFYRNTGVRLNPSLTKNKGYEWLYFDGVHESFQYLETAPAVDTILDCFKTPDKTLVFRDLLVQLQQVLEAEETALEKYVLELLDTGLLEWALPENGLTAGWCGALYNTLGFLPPAPIFPVAAELLQWLRNASRTLQFQNPEQARMTQQEALKRVRLFFEQNEVHLPPLSAEQLFFEEVEQPPGARIEAEVLEKLLVQLGEYWQNLPEITLSKRRSVLYTFAKKRYRGQSQVGFLSFCRAFFEDEAAGKLPAARAEIRAAPWIGKIGAQFQVFRRSDGSVGAVLNGLFPGGGRLMARWMHLFPAYAHEALRDWQKGLIPFPWQGWHNANFQPPAPDAAIAVPGGRLYGASIPLYAVDIRFEDGSLQLVERSSGRPIFFTDLGLEAFDVRPPVMQLLWLLGTPYVSQEALLPAETQRWEPGGKGWQHRPRMEHGNWILQRAAWRIEPALYAPPGAQTGFFSAIRRLFRDIGIPGRFFARLQTAGEKPQFFDLDHPVSVLLLEKMLRQGENGLIITELLPAPEENAGRDRVGEWVGEFNLIQN